MRVEGKVRAAGCLRLELVGDAAAAVMGAASRRRRRGRRRLDVVVARLPPRRRLRRGRRVDGVAVDETHARVTVK